MAHTGVIQRDTPTRIADITDGLSNTLLVAEKRLNLANLGQPQPDDNEGYSCARLCYTIAWIRKLSVVTLLVTIVFVYISGVAVNPGGGVIVTI